MIYPPQRHLHMAPQGTKHTNIAEEKEGKEQIERKNK